MEEKYKCTYYKCRRDGGIKVLKTVITTKIVPPNNANKPQSPRNDAGESLRDVKIPALKENARTTGPPPEKPTSGKKVPDKRQQVDYIAANRFAIHQNGGAQQDQGASRNSAETPEHVLAQGQRGSFKSAQPKPNDQNVSKKSTDKDPKSNHNPKGTGLSRPKEPRTSLQSEGRDTAPPEKLTTAARNQERSTKEPLSASFTKSMDGSTKDELKSAVKPKFEKEVRSLSNYKDSIKIPESRKLSGPPNAKQFPIIQTKSPPTAEEKIKELSERKKSTDAPGTAKILQTTNLKSTKEGTSAKVKEYTSVKAKEDISTKAKEDISTKAKEDISTKAKEGTSAKANEDISTKAKEDISTKAKEGTSAKANKDTSAKGKEEISVNAKATWEKTNEDTPAKRNENTPAMTKYDTLAKTKEDTPAKTKEDTPAKRNENTPAKTKDDTPAKTKEDTPAKRNENTTAKTKDDTPAKTKEDTPAKRNENTLAKKKEDTPAKTKDDTLAKTKEDTPAKTKEDTLAKRNENTPAKTKEDTLTKTKEDTPAKTKEDTPAKRNENTLAKTKLDTPAKTKDDTLAKTKEDTPAKTKEDTPAKRNENTPAKTKEDTLAKTKEDTLAKTKEDTLAKTKEDTLTKTKEDIVTKTKEVNQAKPTGTPGTAKSEENTDKKPTTAGTSTNAKDEAGLQSTAKATISSKPLPERKPPQLDIQAKTRPSPPTIPTKATNVPSVKIENEFMRLKTNHIPLVSLFGLTHPSISQQKLNLLEKISKNFDFVLVNIDKVIGEWKNRSNSIPLSIPELARELGHSLLHKTSAYTNDKTLTEAELCRIMKYAILAYHKNGKSEHAGFILENFPVSPKETSLLEEIIYPIAIGIYMFPATDDNAVSLPVNFRRSTIYDEKLCRKVAYLHDKKLLEILHPAGLNDTKITVNLIPTIQEMLDNYWADVKQNGLQPVVLGRDLDSISPTESLASPTEMARKSVKET